MATLVDLVDNDDEDTPNELLEQDQQEVEETVADNPEPEQNAEELPEKYQGKSASELAKMHANLEELLGRQSKEVGELRQAFDRMVQDNISSKQSAPEPEVDETDFWSNPTKAIGDAISNHPKVKEAEKVSAEMARRASLDALQAKHPDMTQILQDNNFGEWVKSSPIRTQLYQMADQQYDYDAANELFSLWKERRGVAEKQQVVEKEARKQEVKKASTGTARSNPDGRVTKKTYRRRDIIELMNRDPKRYEAMQDEIMRAYAEGRVK